MGIEATRAEQIARINEDLQKKLRVQPLEFKVPEFDESKYLEDIARKSLLTYERRNRDIAAVQQAAND